MNKRFLIVALFLALSVGIAATCIFPPDPMRPENLHTDACTVFNGQTNLKENFAFPRPKVQCGDEDALMKLRLPPGAVAATELSLSWMLAAAVR
jgi:hypothetical protein